MQTRVKKSLVFGILCVLILTSIPTINAEVDHFQNSLVLIFGKCNTTSCGSIWWKFGLYIPVIKRNFFMIASNENESINILILSFEDGFGTYFNYKDITIELHNARGMFYWGGKSLLFNHSNPPPVFALCRAKTAYITT
jgi:hypothetical protein